LSTITKKQIAFKQIHIDDKYIKMTKTMTAIYAFSTSL